VAGLPPPCALGAEDFFDRVGEVLTWTASDAQLRARLSGALALEGYAASQPPPALLLTDDDFLFTPRLTLFLDAQLGARVYAFAQARVDRGFDPSEGDLRGRFDEYAVRFTPLAGDPRFQIQFGKFATVVGNWVPRHHSWANPFITAPAPYENPLGLWDDTAPAASATLLRWAHLNPRTDARGELADKQRRVPLIWGPGYASGASVSGRVGKFDYALELKNAALSSRPSAWSVEETQWQRPTWSGRLGWRPNLMWTLGASASEGSYLREVAAPTLPPGARLEDYRQRVLGVDAGFAWRRWQVWGEAFAARFELPRAGDIETLAWYVEARYKFTPRFFGALRWNEQAFSTVRDAAGGESRWGRNLARLDVAPTFRLTPHVQLKLQWSVQHEDSAARDLSHLVATQATVRF
jgi:hypothetical protein